MTFPALHAIIGLQTFLVVSWFVSQRTSSSGGLGDSCAAIIRNLPMTAIDDMLFTIINGGMANPLFDILMPALTHQGYLLVLPLLPYLLYRGHASRDDTGRSRLLPACAAVLIAFLAFPLADLLGDQLKILIARPRPGDVLEGVRLLVKRPTSFSMPSSHALTSFAAAAPLYLLTRGFVPLCWRIYPLALAGLIALSRPYVGVHYPSDILAGGVLGAAVAALFCRLYRMVEERLRTSPGHQRT